MNDDVTAKLLDKERRLLDAQARHETLSHRRAALDAEMRELTREIADVVQRLRPLGRDRVEFGDLRRTTPISPVWGLDRGLPLDRYYIEAFLDRHRLDIRGRVLEVKDAGYTRMFGDTRVTGADVLDVDASNASATVVADLSRADAIPDDTYDCFILTQTLGVIYDAAGAVRHAVRVLKPGGVLLCTLPAAGRISYEEGLGGDFWRFTEGSVRRLFGEVLPAGAFEVTGHGNVLACAAFLYGLAQDELTREELDVVDPFFPLVYTVRATKASDAAPRAVSSGSHSARAVGAVLTYHRIAAPAHERDRLCVPPEEFRGHMLHLRDAGYRVRPLAELVAEAASGSLEGRSVALTFDDGYLDALTSAAPILESFGLPATFFIVGEALDAPHEFWWDALDRIFLSDHRVPARLAVTLPAGFIEMPTAIGAERAAARDRLTESFYSLGADAREACLRTLYDWSGTRPATDGPRRPMTADEVARLASRPGFSIGAHSHRHLRLPLLSPADRAEDIRAGRTRLEAVAGRRVTSFSYPYGFVDAATVATVRDEGFDLAVTTEARTLLPPVDALQVPRIDAANTDVAAFARVLESLQV
jgi:peptidoglycan/xylan/chitin deacetylase (PgdA/CDA1 family)/SAM-dependent methyltransferase